MLHLGPDGCLEFFCILDQCVSFVFFVKCFAFAGANGNMLGVVDVCIGSVLNALVARIAKGHALLAVQPSYWLQ